MLNFYLTKLIAWPSPRFLIKCIIYKSYPKSQTKETDTKCAPKIKHNEGSVTISKKCNIIVWWKFIFDFIFYFSVSPDLEESVYQILAEYNTVDCFSYCNPFILSKWKQYFNIIKAVIYWCFEISYPYYWKIISLARAFYKIWMYQVVVYHKRQKIFETGLFCTILCLV